MDVIAERTLQLMENGASEPVDVVVRIGRPEFRGEGQGWAGPFQIVVPWEETKTHNMSGEDSTQALLQVIQIIPSYLQIIAKRGKLTWLDAEHTGFPPPLA